MFQLLFQISNCAHYFFLYSPCKGCLRKPRSHKKRLCDGISHLDLNLKEGCLDTLCSRNLNSFRNRLMVFQLLFQLSNSFFLSFHIFILFFYPLFTLSEFLENQISGCCLRVKTPPQKGLFEQQNMLWNMHLLKGDQMISAKNVCANLDPIIKTPSGFPAI